MRPDVSLLPWRFFAQGISSLAMRHRRNACTSMGRPAAMINGCNQAPLCRRFGTGTSAARRRGTSCGATAPTGRHETRGRALHAGARHCARDLSLRNPYRRPPLFDRDETPAKAFRIGGHALDCDNEGGRGVALRPLHHREAKAGVSRAAAHQNCAWQGIAPAAATLDRHESGELWAGIYFAPQKHRPFSDPTRTAAHSILAVPIGRNTKVCRHCRVQ